MKKAVIVGIALFIVGIVPFVGAWNYPYVNIDDPQYFVLPSEVTGGLSAHGVEWALKDISNAIWMPLTWLVYQFDYSIRNMVLACVPSLDGFQLAYSIAHIQSILLHGVNTLLLFGLLMRLAPKHGRLIPAIATLAWAVHPLRVESVVWIASLKDVLSMAFLLVGLNAWVVYRHTDKEGPLYFLAHLFFVLACCAKPSVMTFPALLLLLDATILGKISLKAPRWIDFKVYSPAFCIAIPVALLAQAAQSLGGATNYLSQVPFGYRALNALVSIGVYVRNTCWPTQLAAQCQMQWPNPPHDLMNGAIIGGIVLTMAVTVTVKLFRRLRKGETSGNLFVECGLLWAVGTMLPMLGLSAFGGHAFADRFTYIPLVGLSIALLALPAHLSARTCVVAGMTILAILGLISAHQTQFWENDRKLVERTLAVDGDHNIMAHLNIFRHIFEHEHTPERLPVAIKHFKRAYELDPEMCQSSAIVYMMLLGECGETEGLREVEGEFSDWIRRKYNLWKSVDLEIADGLCDLYDKTIQSPEAGRLRAKELAYRLLSRDDHGVYQINYFIYLVGKETGDTRLMIAAKERIRRIANPRTGHDNSIRFRFIDAAPKCSSTDVHSVQSAPDVNLGSFSVSPLTSLRYLLQRVDKG